MAEYETPGVYVRELPLSTTPITGVETSIAGLAGATERGPLAPQLVTSWSDYQGWYGDPVPDQSFLAYAVDGFFRNGGRRCYLTRIVGQGAAAATLQLSGVLNVVAAGPGTWGNRVRMTVTEAAPADPGQGGHRAVTLTVAYVNAAGGMEDEEQFTNIPLDPAVAEAFPARVNRTSRLIRVWWERPEDAALLAPVADAFLTGGNDGAALTADDFPGDEETLPVDCPFGAAPSRVPPALLGQGRGLKGLAALDEIALLLVPDEVHPAVAEARRITDAVVAQCVARQDRFGLVALPSGRQEVGDLHPTHDTRHAAIYYPWISVPDPSTAAPHLVPATGHIAGVYARTDQAYGVHKSPANEAVQGALDLEFPVTQRMQDILNPRGVNCLRDFRAEGRGIRIWGARTMSQDPEWKYVAVRRLCLYIEQSILRGLQGLTFEPNSEPTWAVARQRIGTFLYDLWRTGALLGHKPQEGYFVLCGPTTMTPDDIANGRLIARVGVALVRPAEFISLHFVWNMAAGPNP